MLEIVQEIATGLGSLMLKIFLIVVPLLVFLEWVRAQRWFGQFIDRMNPLFHPIGFRPQALFSLLTGLIFGVSYGAGVLIPQARSGELDPKQVFLVTCFLGICHAVVEDTLLFVAVGANGFILVVTRFLSAVVLVFFLSRLSWPVVGTVTRDAG